MSVWMVLRYFMFVLKFVSLKTQFHKFKHYMENVPAAMFVVLNNLAHAHTYVFQLCQVSEEMLHDLHLQIVVMMHSNELKYLFLWE